MIIKLELSGKKSDKRLNKALATLYWLILKPNARPSPSKKANNLGSVAMQNDSLRKRSPRQIHILALATMKFRTILLTRKHLLIMLLFLVSISVYLLEVKHSLAKLQDLWMIKTN
jgi:hypothetical protein